MKYYKSDNNALYRVDNGIAWWFNPVSRKWISLAPHIGPIYYGLEEISEKEAFAILL